MTSESTNLDTLLRALLRERPDYGRISVPATLSGKRELLRALMNVRGPHPLNPELLALQDEELLVQRKEKGVVGVGETLPSMLDDRLRLWQGDITRLSVDAIVNAANSRMLGCFVPLHRCIDNAIHSAAGMELREECDRIMKAQGHEEPTGQAKITPGFNLPSKWVIHTVGPIVYGSTPSSEDCRLLADCYLNCMKLADSKGISSIAFCCISTGEFHFPNKQAAEIAIRSVREFLGTSPRTSVKTVVFNVFKDEDYFIYRTLLHVM